MSDKLIEEGQAPRTIGSGLEAPRDSRGFYPEKYADPAIVRRLKALHRDASLEWDRARGRWVLYCFEPEYTAHPEYKGVPQYARPVEYQDPNALVCTWQWPDGSYRELSMALVQEYERCLWRMRNFPGDAVDFDVALRDQQEELRSKEVAKVWAEAREDMHSRYRFIKANADKNIWDDPVKERPRKIFSLPTR